MDSDPQTNPHDSSEMVQELRDEMRRDVRGLAQSIERRPRPKAGVSPLAVMASVFISLFVGAAGMSLYDAKTGVTAETVAPQVDIRQGSQAAMSPYTQQFEQMKQSLEAAQQAATEESNAHRLLLDQLTETVTGLDKSATAQNAAFHKRVDLLADELAAKIARETRADAEPTVAARPTLPAREGAAVQPASAEAEVTGAEEGLDVAEERPAAPIADEPERGELVINNPSDYDLKLLINGQPMDIKARGVTTVDVTVGTVKTQIASLPELVQNWDKWATVEGVPRLTINVESGNGYYQLK